jgi:uncharacterized membrane protein YgcG
MTTPQYVYVACVVAIVGILCAPLVYLWVNVRAKRRQRAAHAAELQRMVDAEKQRAVMRMTPIAMRNVPRPGAWPPPPQRTPAMPPTATAKPRRRDDDDDTNTVWGGWVAPVPSFRGPSVDDAVSGGGTSMKSGGGGDYGGGGASGDFGSSSSSSSSSDSGGGDSGGGGGND